MVSARYQIAAAASMPMPASVDPLQVQLVCARPDGTPVRYDPFRPLHYAINPAGGPAGGTALIRESIAEISAAAGLVFTYDGVTGEPAQTDREPVQQGRYGDRWAPALIGWATAAEDPDLAGYIAGYAGSHLATTPAGAEFYVTGSVVLDSEALRWAPQKPAERGAAKGVVLHELGHLLGLGHVNDPRQLMYSETGRGVYTLADGDLRGLGVLGAGDCILLKVS